VEAKRYLKHAAAIVLFIFPFVLEPGGAHAERRVRVIAENANIKVTPELGGRALIGVPIHTELTAELKEGEFYRVIWMKEEGPISGYIHELLVQEVGGAEAQPASAGIGPFKSQDQIITEIGMKLEESRSLIRLEKDPDIALGNLRPLLARVFTVEDHQKQGELACEIYHCLGLAYAEKGDLYGALQEFRNMFEVDAGHAREITRSISDPVRKNFVDLADKLFSGVLIDFSLEIDSDPEEAAIQIDGKDIGKTTPYVYRSQIPKFELGLAKEGFKLFRESILLSKPSETRKFELERSGRNVIVRSIPPGARIYLDGKDTGKVSDCELPFVPYGNRTVKLQKDDWADWEGPLQLAEGPGPAVLTAPLAAKNYAFARKLGGAEAGFTKMPRAIAFDRDGNIYLADESDFKVRKFDSEGRWLRSWGDAGREFRTLQEPSGILIDGQGSVYVSDAKGASISKFSRNGRFIFRWGKTGAQSGELNTPLSLAADRNGDIYVADWGNNRVVKYTASGVVKKIWGRQGTGQGEFVFPTAIAVSRRNEVFVLDRIRVQKFNLEGEFIAAWGKIGMAPGEINAPQGLCLDQMDFIYIADSGNNRIIKFDSEGKFIGQWGSAGTDNGQMTAPVCVAVNDKGSVFVVEMTSGRIQEFKVPAP